MSVRLQIAAMVYLMIQAVMFGAFTIVLLVSPLSGDAMALMPVSVAVSSVLSMPLAWWLAPRLRARTWRREGEMDLLR